VDLPAPDGFSDQSAKTAADGWTNQSPPAVINVDQSQPTVESPPTSPPTSPPLLDRPVPDRLTVIIAVRAAVCQPSQSPSSAVAAIRISIWRTI
jgi:hypothetical protein